ncbi:MAG: hypothetical protein HZA22_00270 [Nitrospirae bacterium]|nr:hypothetical protein [Nitrospirota bacterium]MBI5694391.1 hypothetical protein [Nitrospirota bacterium]
MPELSEKLCFTLDQELGGTEGSEPPDTVQVLPAGEVNPRGKTSFLVDEESRRMILDAYEKGATDLVVDYEHQSLSGSEAPAAGWIKAIEDRGESGVWAIVQWTERAREYLRSREYRYLSPVVLIRKRDGRAVELLGAALTNLPAIDGMVPVVNTARPVPGEAGAARDMECGGLCHGMLEMLGLPEGSGLEEVRAKVESIANPEGYVPASEYQALKDELKTREADGLVKEALASGRIPPSLAGWARSYAMDDPDGFREFAGKSCPVVPLGRMDGLDVMRVLSIDAPQRSVNVLLGIDDKSFARYGQPAL